MRLQGWRAVLAAAPLAVLSLALTSCSDDDNGTGSSATVTATTVRVAPVSGMPSTPFVFTGEITATGSGPVTFRWVHDDGTQTDTQTLNFTGAGTQTVTHTWDNISCSTSERSKWAKLEVLTPNAMSSTQTAITVNAATSCP
jgi:hypothetical protein